MSYFDLILHRTAVFVCLSSLGKPLCVSLSPMQKCHSIDATAIVIGNYILLFDIAVEDVELYELC